MNRVDLIGNLCRDHVMNYTTGENAKAILKNTIAVQRKFKNAEGKYDSDFISITAFGNTAEFLNKYFSKGSKVAISGRIQTGSYVNKEGNTVYTTDVIVEDAEFVTKKDENPANNGNTGNTDFVNVPDSDESSLPFK